MYRFAQKEIKRWFYGNRRKPMVLRGARQVGKSTVVRMAAEEMGLELKYSAPYLDRSGKRLNIPISLLKTKRGR